MIQIRFDSTPLVKALTEAEQGLVDSSALMSDIANYLRAITEERFETETDPDGNPWPDISASHKEYKNRKGLSTHILHMHGHLFGTMYTEFDDRSAFVALPQEYAHFHQDGAPSNNLPRRTILGLSAQHEREISDIAEGYLQQILK